MYRNQYFSLFIILVFAGLITAGCTTTKNTGVAIKEGSTEVAQQAGDKAEDVGETIEDASITSAIKMKFANDELVSASNINVDTDEGNVTLSGIVSNQAELDRAMQLGRSVDGVNSVHSNLTMSSNRK